MKDHYKTVRVTFTRWLMSLAVLTVLWTTNANAQVDVTATAGTVGPTTYTTLKLAFDAINAGTHQGAITIDITANTTEGTTPATLNSNAAGAALYTSVLIRPTVDGVSISGNPITGFGVIQLKGADNVTIDGDNPNSGGTNRNLTVNNTTTATTTANSVIRIATAATVVTSADNNIIRNCNINGNVTAGNSSLITSTTGSSNLSFGIYCGGNGGLTAIDAPTAITSVTTNTAPSGTTINNLTIDNNAINQCARAIVFNGAAATVSAGTFTATNNLIGGAGSNSGTPPFATPTTTVYTKGIWMNGLTAAVVTGNTIQNIMSFVGTATTGIECVAAIGAGSLTITGNSLTSIVCNGTSAANAIQLANSTGGTYNISNNTISNTQSVGSSCTGILCATAALSGTISKNTITTVRSRSTGGVRACGIALTTATAGAVTISNNSIAEVLNIGSASFGNSFNANGILIASGNNHKVYHNSVNLFGVSTSAGSNSVNCLAITASTQTGIDVRNNIFSNTVTGGAATDAHTCVFLPFVASGTMLLTLNNNTYYTGSIANKSGVAFAGATTYAAANVFSAANFNAALTTPATNFRSYSSALGVATNDNASYASTTAAPYTTSTNLLLDVGNAETINNIWNKGAAGTGVTTDIQNEVRPQGVATNNTIGSDEVLINVCVAAVGGTVSPATASACSGLTYLMTSTGATTGAGISYQWEISATGGGVGFANVSGGSGAATSSYTTGALSAGVYFYRLKVVCSNGPITAFSNELTLTVNALPIVAVSPTSATYCVGSAAVALTASGASTYAWSPASGLSAVTGTPVNASPAANTTYTLSGTDGNGCIGTATAVISVGGVTSVSATATPPAVCTGNNSQLNAVAVVPACLQVLITEVSGFETAATGGTGGGGTISPAGINDPIELTNISTASVDVSGWQLEITGTTPGVFIIPGGNIIPAGATFVISRGSTGGAAVPGVFVPSPLTTVGSGTSQGIILSASGIIKDVVALNGGTPFNPVGSGTPVVTAGDWSGTIASSLSTGGIRRTVAADGNTSADWVVSSGGSLINFGIVNTAFTPAPCSITYAWSPSTFIAGQEALQNPLATAVTATTAYTVLVTDAVGCTNTSTATVTVDPLTCSPATFTSPNCAGSNFTVTANQAGGGAPFNYAWSDGVGGIYPNAQTITANLAAGTYTFTATITDACGGSCNSSVIITINPLPTVAVSPTSATYCVPGSAIALAASGASTYAWSPAGGLSAVTGANVSASPTSTTTYTVSGTDGNGCVNTATSLITRADAPTIVSTTATPPAVCFGATSALNVVATIPLSAANYSFAASTSIYSPLVGGTNSTAAGDDGTQTSIPIGFTFNLAGVSYTTFGITTNGAIQLGATAPPLTNNLATNANVIAAIWDDNNRGTGTITHLTTGTAPNRVLTIDWNLVAIGGGGSSANSTNQYQINLYETSGIITISYGSLTSANGITASIGISSATGQFLSVTPAPVPTTSTVSSNNTIASVVDLPSGTLYTFTPPATTLTYSWLPAFGLLPDAVSASVTTPPIIANTTYTVDVANGSCISQGTVSVTTGAALTAAPTATPPAPASYCASTHANGCSGDDITLVVLNTLNNPTTGCGGVPHFTYFTGGGAQTTSLAASSSHSLSVSFGSDGNQFFGAWIDYDQNGVYDVSEFLGASANAGSGGTATVSFTVPAAPINGVTRMRIVGGNDSPVTSAQACGASSSSFGETQDYNITITGGASNTPCPNTVWTLAANATGGGAPYTYSWVPTVGVSDPTIANPTLTPSASGTYTVFIADACAATTSQSVSVTVQSVPVAVTPITTNVCGTPGVTLTASGATTYSWSPAGSLNTATGAVVIASPTAPTTVYTVTGTLGACTNTATTTINYTAPTPVTITNSTPVICGTGGGTSTLGVTTTGSYTYAWTESLPGTLSSLTGAPVTATITQTTAYTLTATGFGPDAGCVVTASTTVSQIDFPNVVPTAVLDTICPATSTVIRSNTNASSFTVTAAPYAPIAPVSPVDLCNGGVATVPQASGNLDDGGWSSIPLGFTFNYFGNSYTTVNIGTNGVMQFGAYNANDGFTPPFGLGDFSFTGLPSTGEPLNVIAPMASDMDLRTSGVIRYWTSGVAPTRVFVMEMLNVPGFSTNNGNHTVQAQLFETTGQVEIHVFEATKPTAKTIGLQDLTGLIGATAPGRNGFSTTITTPEAWHFEPPHTYTFLWAGVTVGANITGSAAADTVVVSPTGTGDFIYSLTVTDNVTTCTDVINKSINVTTATPVANFTGTPLAGTSGGFLTTHTFTNTSTLGSSNTYAWSFSPNTVTYVNGTSATSANPQVQFTAFGVYDVTLVATNCNGSDSETKIGYITITPGYCLSNATSLNDEEIFEVNIGSMSNTTDCFTTGAGASLLNQYSDFTTLVAAPVLAIGTTYPFSLLAGSCGGVFSAGYSVFIDFNQDGDFDDLGEKVLGSTTTTSIPVNGIVLSGNVYIPPTATGGLTRMRVVLEESNATPLSCGTYGFGETEDYLVDIFLPTVPPNCVASSSILNGTCVTATSISWPVASGFPTGYYVSYGLTPAANDLVNQQDVGNTTTLLLPTLLPATLYYYLIEPYNLIGTALGCTPGAPFTSGASTTQTPTQSPASYTETMDNGVFPPALPCGVTSSNENFPADAFTWITASGASEAHLGTRYLRIDKNTDNATAKDDWFYSAPMNLTAGKLYRIYFWHRVGTAGTENFELFLSNSADAATMQTTSAIFVGSSNLVTYKLDSSANILPVVTGVYYYGFHANGAANGRSLFMDDIQVREIPVAALDPASCTTLASMYDQILVQPIYQAQDYKFLIENLTTSFSYEYTRNLAIPDFRLKWAPGVTYGLTYDVSVSYKKNNVWSPYGAPCPVTMGPFPTTQLRGTSCGAILTDTYTQLFYDSIAGANDYEIKIVQNTLAYDHTWTRGGSQLDYRMYWAYQSSPTLVDRTPYGFTYDVQVRALVGRTGPLNGNLPGTYGTFGPVCTVQLLGQPQTQLVALPGPQQSCGKTLVNLNDPIYCIPVTGAGNYRYHVVNTALGYDVLALRNSAVNDYRLTWLPVSGGIGLRFATTYDITVSNNVGGVWSAEGPVCQVTTPASPLTSLTALYCPYTLPTFSTPVYSTNIIGATNYRYRITDVATSGATYTKIVDRNSPGNDFRFNWTLVCCGGLNMLANTPYNVEVASYAGGVWSAYGSVCVVTTGASVPRYSQELAEEGLTSTSNAALSLNVYPNPAAVAQEFAVELNGIQKANETVLVTIYNVLGERVYRSQIITKEESRMVIKPEQVLAPGVYTIEAQLNGSINRVKFVVQ